MDDQKKPLNSANLVLENENCLVDDIREKFNKMATKNSKMVTDLKAYLRSMVVKVVDQSGELFFNQPEVDEIATKALLEDLPQLTARQWLVVGHPDLYINWGKYADYQTEIASMTKVCTALVVCRILKEMGIGGIQNSKNIFLKVHKYSEYIGTLGTTADLTEGMKVSIYDCFCGMMLPSGNDCAMTFCIEFGRYLYLLEDGNQDKLEYAFINPNIGFENYIASFVSEMNRLAQYLGCSRDCAFINPHGMHD